ncbi:DUF1382 family protein [Pseudomonas sp. N3-W]|uniref:DUF1382 family protein n=1 Tax=Pseudomonas fungipugnans TaxID=3024217 RepID=A0ABT6QI11_9PSED|nr:MULTISPECIES: DUF1382 family protein [unclassified Pseudomonas]MDI2589847.1 DUF1382 family protein [Pseudomonas sp. 681]UWF46896.1 DUF1382 family protein [Pseudomonas sp. N3-W]
MKAHPKDLHKSMETAQTFAKAGVLFVCVPAMNASDYSDLVHLAKERIGKLADEAEDAPHG